MRKVKEVEEITGVSIRTLRYYDEIGLLIPAKISEAGYRLYDDAAIERLQQIMFFRELEMPLSVIKEIMSNPDYDKGEALLAQKSLLEKKRDRLNGILELIGDVMKGVNTMSFEAFNEEDVNEIIAKMEENLTKEDYEQLIQTYGEGEEKKYRASLLKNLKDDKISAELIKWYGSKDKAKAAAFEPIEGITDYQKENQDIYQQLAGIAGKGEKDAEKNLISRLAECYKGMFHLDNARAILIDLAKEYQNNNKLKEANDSIYGEGSTAYIAGAIMRYYGL